MTNEIPGMKPHKIIKNDEERTICYFYKSETTPESDTEPQVLLCGCLCPIPEEEYPFDDGVFEYLKKIAHWIKHYSDQYRVPPIAVAGSIADEYNSRFTDLKRVFLKKKLLYGAHSALKKAGDFVQDKVIPSGREYAKLRTEPDGGYPGIVPPYYTSEIDDTELNARIEQGYQELKKIDPKNENRPSSSEAINREHKEFKYSYSIIRKNFTIWSDYGTANISLRTAIDLYTEYRKTFALDHQNFTHAQMLRYLVTDRGTAQFTAISILEAKKKMEDLLPVLPPRKQEAVLVTFFKQGIKYRKKYEENNKDRPHQKIKAGEGCRTCYQRKKIGNSIGISVKSLE